MVACVGGGSNAIGLFHPFLADEGVRLFGVEAAGHGLDTGQHAAALNGGRPGVLHGNKTYLLQDADGQITDAHSISAGLDYPGIGPEHAWLHDVGRATYLSATDDEALEALPALRAAGGHHPGAGVRPRPGPRWPSVAARASARTGSIVLNLSGRGDKDLATVAEHLGTQALTVDRLDARFAALKAEGRAAFVAYVMAGDPDAETSLRDPAAACPGAGADIIELGFPFSDPMAEGPPIQRAALRALKAGMTLERPRSTWCALPRRGRRDTPIVLMGYLNPILSYGFERLRRRRRRGAGVDGADRGRLPAGGGRSAGRRARRGRRLADPAGDADHRRRAPAGRGPAHLGLRLLRLGGRA